MTQAATSSRVTAGVTAIQLAAAGPRALATQASATCAPSLNHFNRTQACWNAGATRGVPFLTSLATLLDIAMNIAKAQAGPGHYGRAGSGHPLHHITNAAQQRANYNAVCARSVVGPPPAGKSCDEYPFKTTKEGGKTLSAANRHTAWVPTAGQNSQGGRITAFYNANRVLNGDAFWVVV